MPIKNVIHLFIQYPYFQFLCFVVANYGLAGQYTVHTDSVFIMGDAVARKQMREVWNIHAGDRFATVSLNKNKLLPFTKSFTH